MPRVYGNALVEAALEGLELAQIYQVRYGTINEYYAGMFGGGDPFDVRDAANDEAPEGVNYIVVASLPDQGPGGYEEQVNDHGDFRLMVTETMALDSKELDEIFNKDGEFNIEFTVYRAQPFGNANIAGGGRMHNFMAGGVRSRFWGPLGKVNNCVVRQVSERVEGYLSSGEKRSYMWGPNGRRHSVVRASPDYNAAAAKSLAQDKVYIKIKKGVAAFLSARDTSVTDTFGFDVRDLCDLAELCDIRIVVWMRTRMFPVQRWDTNDKVGPVGEEDKRYHFHFWMTDVQHLEMCSPADVRANEANPGTLRHAIPGTDKVCYVDDDWFGALFSSGFPPGYNPGSAEDRRVFTIARTCLRWPLPGSARMHLYSDKLVYEGGVVYKHECYRQWLQDMGLDPEDPATSDIMCDADIHWKRLRRGYAKRNMRPVKQKKTPSLFEAIAYADKVTTHTLVQPVREGEKVWEVDGRKWYATRFADVADFPYFHGYPAADTWSEYNGTETRPVLDPASGRFIPSTTYVGNMHEGDRPFTFGYGKYAIFLVEELDLSGCEEHTLEHMRRDRLFVDFDPRTGVLPVASPVLHFLQDLGARWRASHVWVCYGCVDDWVADEDPEEEEELRDDMIASKSYAICVGRLMSGRWPVSTTKYVTPDEATAQDLLAWHSASFVVGNSDDIVFDGVPRRHAANALVYTENADVYGTKTVSGASMSRGGYLLQKRAEDEDGPAPPFTVSCSADMYGLGSTLAHVSGAVHAMCFVRLYSTALRIPPEHVAGFSLDSIKCFVDPTGYLGDLISDSDDFQGTFKPAEYKEIARVYRSRSPLLSPLYAPRAAFQGFAAPDKKKPLWGAYQDSLGQFNIVPGKAGSGKTWRHLRAHGSSDQRVDRVLYAPLTNYLAAQLKSQGIPSTTSFKAFNRRVDDAATVRGARQRYISDNQEQRRRLEGFAAILRDEVTMDSGSMILDAIRCCNENHKQLLLVGDFDRERFYQLSAVREGGPEMMAMALEQAAGEIGRKQLTWVPAQPVYRQAGDPELTALLDSLRDHEGSAGERWSVLERSPLFEHHTYEDMLRTIDPERDVVINPWHRNIEQVTVAVLDGMGPDDPLVLRGNFQSPYKVKESDPEPIRSLVQFEGDPRAHKGVTCAVTKRELEALRGTRFMAKGYPYKGGSTDGNMVNPMIGASVFALQGITLEEDATLWVMASSQDATEWQSDEQPCQAYVTASRARRRAQIKIVVMDRNIRRRFA